MLALSGEDLSKHGHITGIGEPLRARVYDEGEEGTKKGKTESFGGLLETLGKVTQEGQNLLWGKGFGRPVTKLGRKLGEKVEVISERVFFSSSSCGNQEKTLRLGILSWQISFLLRVYNRLNVSQAFHVTRFFRGSLSGLQSSIRMVTEKMLPKRLVVVSVFNARFSYRGKSLQDFQGILQAPCIW